MSLTFKIRLMSPADLPFCDELRQISGWNQTPQDWQRFLDFSPNGCFIAERQGRPLGTVTTVLYRQELAWIGMLLVEPAARGQGIGKALLRTAIDFLRAEKVRCIKLDATPQGESLYQKQGFKSEWALTRFEARNLESIADPAAVRDSHSRDLPEMIAIDAKAFGLSRARLVESLCASALRSVVIERDNKLHGFALLRSGSVANYFGPVVATSKDCAALLVRALADSSAEKPVYWDIPAINGAAVGLATELGFAPQRPLLRMFFGNENLSGSAQYYFGIADPSLG